MDHGTSAFFQATRAVLGSIYDLRRELQPLRQGGHLHLPTLWQAVKPGFYTLVDSLSEVAPLLDDAPAEAQPIVDWLRRIGHDVKINRDLIERYRGDGSSAMFEKDAFSNLLLAYGAEMEVSQLVGNLERATRLDPLKAFEQSGDELPKKYTVRTLIADLGALLRMEERLKIIGSNGALVLHRSGSREAYQQQVAAQLDQQRAAFSAKIFGRDGVKRLRLLWEAKGSDGTLLSWLRQQKAQLSLSIGDHDGSVVEGMTPNEFAENIDRSKTFETIAKDAEVPRKSHPQLPILTEFLDQLDISFSDPAKLDWLRSQIGPWITFAATKGADGEFPKVEKPLPPRATDTLDIPSQCAALATIHDELFNGPRFFPVHDPEPDEDHETAMPKLLQGMMWEGMIRRVRDNDPSKWIVELRAMLRRVETAWSEVKNQKSPVSTDQVHSAKRPRKSKELSELEKVTPAIDRDSGCWVSTKRAASLEGLETTTLTSYRNKGLRNKDKTIGRDKDGRVWRRDGTPNSHPMYLRKSLVVERAETTTKIP